jgi:ribosomal protein S11/ribosomal protein S13
MGLASTSLASFSMQQRSQDKRSDDLDDNESRRIREVIEKLDMKIEGDLRRDIGLNIKRLMDLGCYRVCATSRVARARPTYPHQFPHRKVRAKVKSRRRSRLNRWLRIRARRRLRRTSRAVTFTSRDVQQHDGHHHGRFWNVLSWSSAGVRGFKGSRKSTPFAAQLAAEDAAAKRWTTVFVTSAFSSRVPGRGRESALRALAPGVEGELHRDLTPIPHNGCRRPSAAASDRWPFEQPI